MLKDNKASISRLRNVILIGTIIICIMGIIAGVVGNKLDSIKITYADGSQVVKESTTVANSEVDDTEALRSVLDTYDTVSERVVKEDVSIPYETETNDLSTGNGEKKETVVKNGSEGLKEIVYLIRSINGVEEEKIQIAENIIENPVDCVKEIRDVEVPVVTSRSSSSLDESYDDDDDYEDEDSSDYDGDSDYEWDGKKLTKSAGVVSASQTPSGYRETYYNLNMNGCLRAMGLDSDGYGVRADGVKTYNGYVMVASPNLSKYPKGSYIPTTLGMGYVVDYCPSGALDIAVTW